MLAHPDARTVLRAVLKAWLPLSEAVLSMGVEHLPDPATAAPGRLARLLPPQQLHLKGVQLSKHLQQVWVHPEPFGGWATSYACVLQLHHVHTQQLFTLGVGLVLCCLETPVTAE